MATTTAQSPAAGNTEPAQTQAMPEPTRLAAARAFGVMLGGPLALLATTAVAATRTVSALRARRRPSAAAAAVLAGAAAYGRWMVPWMRRWGALDAELTMVLQGDETVPDAAFRQTHAVRVEAPASEVWPWIAQIGQDRGGFYSHTWLENLAGCEMRNADRIHPEWQEREVGETVLLHPATGLKLLRIDPGRALVFEGGWSLHVEPDGPDRCHLLTRFRAPAGAAGAAYALLLELPHFVMERRMLLEVKRLAEGRS